MNEWKRVNLGVIITAVVFAIALAVNLATFFRLNLLGFYNAPGEGLLIGFLLAQPLFLLSYFNDLRGWRLKPAPVNLTSRWAWWIVVGYCLLCFFGRPGDPYRSAHGFFDWGSGHHQDRQIDQQTYLTMCNGETRFLTALWLVACAYSIAKSKDYQSAEPASPEVE